MSERHLIAYAILLVCMIAALLLWRRVRRVRRVPERHLRIDLMADPAQEPTAGEP